MNILQINKYHYIKGGADSVFFNTMQLLSEHGHHVVPFCIRHDKNLSSEYGYYFVDAPEIRDIKNISGKIRSIPRFLMNQGAAIQLEKLLLAEKFDVAHIHNLFNGISLAILPILKKHNIPIVITLHDTRFICPSSYFNLRGKWCKYCHKSLFLNCAVKRCYQDNLPNSLMTALEMFHKTYIFPYDSYISKYIFVSRCYKKKHSLRKNSFEEKGEVLYNFSKTDWISESKKGDYVLYYGRITAEKGIERLVEAMKQLPEVRLKVAGTGPLLDSLKENATENIEFLGFASGNILWETIRKSSFVLVPSEWEENNPLTIIESYSLGKPVIGAEIGGIPEIIEDGKTGYIFRAHDAESLAETIRKAVSVTADRYEYLSANAKQFAGTHFTQASHYEHLMKIYKQAIDENI